MRHFVIDCRFASTPSGLGRFTRELTEALLKTAPARWTLLIRRDSTWRPSGPNIQLIDTDAGHYSQAEQWELPRLLRHLQPDAFYAPHFNAPLLLNVPLVVTIHDFILHRYPNDASLLRQAAYRLLMRAVAKRARTICAVSPFVAEEIRSMYGPRIASKTVITGEGVPETYAPRSSDEQDAIRQHYGLKRPFLLYVGNAKQHKNIAGLLSAFERASLPDTDLVLVASGKEADAFAWPTSVIRLHDVPDSDLPALYSAAAACVTMSRYEGYCLPLVEALACGCPIVAPALTAIPGVIGTADGATLLPNLNPQTFAAAFRALPKRPAPRRLGSWDGPAAIVRKALEDVSPKS